MRWILTKGFSTPDLTTDRGERSTASIAYLKWHLHSPALTVIPGATVTKVTTNEAATVNIRVVGWYNRVMKFNNLKMLKNIILFKYE